MADTQTKTLVDPEMKSRLGSLYNSMSGKLKIKAPPRVVFTRDQKNADNPFGNTGYYDPKAKYIRVYITNRHPTDIFRSFAHELIHHWQNENGTLPTEQGSHEHYAQKDPNLRQREMEAYLLGNILFRDWQDENRYGPLNESVDKKNVADLMVKNFIVEFLKSRLGQIVPDTLSEKELRGIIRERIEEALDKFKKPKKSKWDDEEWEKKAEPTTHTVRNQNYAQWLKGFLATDKKQRKQAEKYYDIGTHVNQYYTWYWNPTTKQVVYMRGGSHQQNFGNQIPYETFRGRYDMVTHELSLTIPEYGAMKITGKMEEDVPPDLLRELNRLFKNPKIFYFPFRV